MLKSVTDLVFSCKLKDNSDAFVHIVLEHKSYPDALVCVQILKYMALIWDHYRRKHPGNTNLPFVIPLVFYRGSERWTPKPLRAFFPQDSPFLSCVPDFEMPVYDLGKVPEERLREDIIHNAMQLLLKALIVRDDRSAAQVVHALRLIQRAASDRTEIMDLLELFFNYMSMVRPEITPERINEELAKLPEGEDIMQTWRERYDEYAFNKSLLAGEAKGKKEGIQLGKAEGKAEGIQLGERRGEARGIRDTLFDILTAQFGIVSVRLVEKLRNIHDAVILRKLTTSVFKADSLAAFEALVDRALENGQE